MGKECGGWHWRRGGGDWVGSHMAADKERGKADRAKGTEEGGKRGSQWKDNTPPSAKWKSSGDPCVFMLKCGLLTDNGADPIQQEVMRADSNDATNLDRARGARVKTRAEGYSMLASVRAVCISCMKDPAWASARKTNRPGSSVCLRRLATSWVIQVLGCPVTSPGPPITAALQACSVNCHLLPDQY